MLALPPAAAGPYPPAPTAGSIESSGGGYGLTGMRERLRLLNGTLLAGPRDNEWAVTAELPLAAADDGLAAAEDEVTR